jgi:hypothetical protein
MTSYNSSAFKASGSACIRSKDGVVLLLLDVLWQCTGDKRDDWVTGLLPVVRHGRLLYRSRNRAFASDEPAEAVLPVPQTVRHVH